MKNINVKNLLFVFALACMMSACSDKNAVSSTEAKSDSTSQAKEDSVNAAEGKEAKDAFDAVKR